MEYPEECNDLPRKERKKKIKELKHLEESKSLGFKRVRVRALALIILVLVIGGGYYLIGNSETLPPTDIAGHIEENPSSHILDEPMSIAIQKHMLEHADGDGPPGVVINYNCDDFTCQPDLKEKLSEIAGKFPEFVYVAPYPNMSKMIAVTRLGKIQTFDSLDTNAIIKFIEE